MRVSLAGVGCVEGDETYVRPTNEATAAVRVKVFMLMVMCWMVFVYAKYLHE